MLGEVTNKFSHKSLLMLLGRMSRRLKTERFVIADLEIYDWKVCMDSAECSLLVVPLAACRRKFWVVTGSERWARVTCVLRDPRVARWNQSLGNSGQLLVAADRCRQTPALCVQTVRKDLDLALSLVCHQEEWGWYRSAGSWKKFVRKTAKMMFCTLQHKTFFSSCWFIVLEKTDHALIDIFKLGSIYSPSFPDFTHWFV